MSTATNRIFHYVSGIATDSSDNFRGGTTSLLQELQGPADTSKADLQPHSFSSDIHEGSHEKYKEMVKKTHAFKCETQSYYTIPGIYFICCNRRVKKHLSFSAPNKLYTTPLTDNQQYGWMVSESPEPWTQVRRFPRRFSEMTK